MNIYKDIKINNEVDLNLPRNLIVYGAPGTGKSYKLNKLKEKYFTSPILFKRITFYANYSYSQFVGSYKPSPAYKLDNTEKVINILGNQVDEPIINYEYVPGPFLTMVLKAIRNPQNNYLIIIEEINRGNAASIFGDLFQVLDRDKYGKSEYSVEISNELKHHLLKDTEFEEELKYEIIEKGIYIPSNLYIWATMNSADQGVFPMDTAFKRRWSFEYIDIDAGKEKIDENIVKLGTQKRPIKWNELRTSINNKLISLNINEDKLLGPFFLSMDEQTNEEKFEIAFKNKVLMYLYEDVLKHKKSEFFKENISTYSRLIKSYDEIGGDIFDFILNYEPLKYISSYEDDEIEELTIDYEQSSVAQEEDHYVSQLKTNEE